MQNSAGLSHIASCSFANFVFGVPLEGPSSVSAGSEIGNSIGNSHEDLLDFSLVVIGWIAKS